MKDYLARGIAFGGLVRAVAIDLTNAVQEAQRRHHTMPTASAALGRLMIASAVMGSTLKDSQQLTLQVKGNGPLGSIFANCNYRGDVRGYVTNPDVVIAPRSNTKLDVAAGVGQHGMLYVTKDLGFGDPYRGSVELVSGEIAEDIAQYYVASEQIPTVFAAGVLVGAENKVMKAGGYLIQLMPGAGDEIIDILEQQVSAAPMVTQMLTQEYTPEDIIMYFLGEHQLQLLPDKNYYQFNCLCNKKYLHNVLLSLGRKELESLQKKDNVEVCCQFCNECYLFDAAEIAEILQHSIDEEESHDERN